MLLGHHEVVVVEPHSKKSHHERCLQLCNCAAERDASFVIERQFRSPVPGRVSRAGDRRTGPLTQRSLSQGSLKQRRLLGVAVAEGTRACAFAPVVSSVAAE